AKSVWDPSSSQAKPSDEGVNVPGRLRVAVIVAPPAGNPVKVKESQIDADARPLCDSAVRTPDARSADDDSENELSSLPMNELDTEAVVDPAPPLSPRR